MRTDIFHRPVCILVGLGLPTEIGSVTEAYRTLNEWPTTSKDTGRSIALKACREALRGKIEVETARSLFVAFAERNHILAPDMDVATASAGHCEEASAPMAVRR